MQKSNRLFQGNARQGGFRQGGIRHCKWLCLTVIMAFAITSLSLPLWANNSRQNNGGLMGDLGDGIRNFGRDVSDMVDPDGDGILPDGSLDNGIAGDGSQNMPSNTSGNSNNTQPDSGDNGNNGNNGNAPSQGTDGNNQNGQTPQTSEGGAQTTPSTTTENHGAQDGNTAGNAQDGDTTNDHGSGSGSGEDGGFRWGGVIIALVIAAAVILLIVMLIPKRKNENNG